MGRLCQSLHLCAAQDQTKVFIKVRIVSVKEKEEIWTFQMQATLSQCMSTLTPKHLGSPFWMADFRVCWLLTSLRALVSSIMCTFRSWETATAISCRWQQQKLFHTPKASGMQSQTLPFPQWLLQNPSLWCATIEFLKKRTIFLNWRLSKNQLEFFFKFLFQWGHGQLQTHCISITLGTWFKGLKCELDD